MMMRKNGSGRNNVGELERRNKNGSRLDTKTNKRLRKKESPETGYINSLHKTNTSSFTSINSAINESDVSGLNITLINSNSRMRSLAGNRSNTSSSLNGISKTANKIGKSKSKDILINQISTTNKPLKDLGPKVKQESGVTPNCDDYREQHKQDKNYISEKSLRSRTIISTNVPNSSFFLDNSVAQSPKSSSFSFSATSKMNSSNSKFSCDHRNKAMSTSVLPSSRKNRGRLSSSSSSHSVTRAATISNSLPMLTNESHGTSTNSASQTKPHGDSGKTIVNGSSRLSSENISLLPSPETQPAVNQITPLSPIKPNTSQNSKKSSNINRCKTSAKNSSFNTTTSIQSIKSTNISSSSKNESPSKPNRNATKKPKGKRINKKKPNSAKKASLITPKQSNKKIDQRKVKKVKCNARIKKEPTNTKETDDESCNQIRRRGQRMASLNAICKVHLLFESERDMPIVSSNSVVSPTPPPSPTPTVKVAKSYSKTTPAKNAKKSQISKDDKKKKSDSKKKNDKKVNSAKKTKKKEPASKVKDLVLHDSKNKQVAVRRKRKLVDEDIEFIDTRSCKRMASLNASAMLAASALSERKVFKRSRSIESTRSTGSTVEIHETKISSSRKSRLQVPQNGGNTMHSCTADQVVVESAQTIELVKKVRRSSGKIRERLLAIEMMEREYNMVGKELKQTAIENGRKFIKSGLGEVTAKSVKKCRRSIQSTTTTREATTGLRRTTEYQVTKVQINTSEATDLSNEREKTAHQIETILNEDAIVQKYHIHHQTKASSQSYRVQMETSSFHPSSNPSANFITSSNAVHTVPCLPLYPSSNGPTVGDLHLANGANILQNNPLLTATNQGLNHNAAAAAAAAAACFSYPNQPSIVHVACNQPYRALTSSNSSINQINPIPVLNIGPQYPSHYASAFSVPNHSNHAASINYPTESYGFYQHSGPIIQPIHDPYIRAYSLHKPVPYHASQMAHHSDQTYREFNPIKRSSYSQQPQHPQQYTSTPHSHPSHTFPNPPPPHPLQSSMQKPQHPPLPSMSSHNPLSPMSNSPLTSPHQPSSQPQQLPPQSQQSVPGTSRFETNSFSSKAISYEQPSYYILQYPNNDISCSLRANNMYHNLSSTNDQITIHQSPHHDSQHLSVNIAVNNPTSFMGRDSMATTQAVQSNQRNLSSIQPISVPPTSSFSSSNGSTGGPSIAFLGSTSILPGHLTPSMFQTLASSSSSAANSIINPELPQGISPVPGPAPVAIATPVSVDNLTTLSSASPSNLVKEMASFNTNAISTQVGLPSTSNNNHTRSPSYESPNVNHQSNVAKISPLLTSSTNRFSKSVQCSTNTNPESKRSCHQQSSVSSTSQSNIIITPVNVTSSTNNHPSVNNVSNTSAFTHTANNTNAENLNGSNKQRLVTSSHQNNSLKDASVNSSYSDSSTTNMTRKLHRKQTEINNASVLNKHKSQSSRVRYPQAKTSPPSSKSSATISTTTPLTKSTATSTSPSNFNEPTLLKSTTGTSSSSTSPDQIVTSSDRSASNSHANGQLNSTKKRPTKSNKSLIDSNSVNESPTTTIVSSIEVGLARKAGKKKLFHGWSWRGNPSKKPVFIKPDEPPKLRDCYPAICHIQGDVIKVRDSVLLRGGPRKTDLHFVAKICALWEAPETGEMMMSLLWYYRPEHTEPGRKPHDQMDEIFASKHQDVNSVACIDDKCYVLTFNEYCRFRKIQKMESENLSHSLTETVVPTGKDYKRRGRIPMRKVFPDRVFFCRKVYDFRLGRTLKNPVSPVITDISVWRR